MVDKLTKEQRDKITRSQERKAWKIVREKVLERDGHKCLACGSTYMLNAHHLLEKEFLIFRYLKYDIRNLVSLCPNCHKFGPFSIHRNPLYVLEFVRNKYINNYKFLLGECKLLSQEYKEIKAEKDRIKAEKDKLKKEKKQREEHNEKKDR